MTFIMFQEVIALVTSLEGALLLLAGLVVLASHSPSFWNHIRPMLTENSIFAPFILIAVTFSGFYFQISEFVRKKSGMSG